MKLYRSLYGRYDKKFLTQKMVDKIGTLTSLEYLYVIIKNIIKKIINIR